MPRVGSVGERASWGIVAGNSEPLTVAPGKPSLTSEGFENQARVPDSSVAEQLAYHRGQVAALEQQQRDDLTRAIVAQVGAGVVFSSADLWAYRLVNPALRQALEDLGIRSARQLGKRLRQLSRVSDNCSCHVSMTTLERIGVDHNAALWMVRS